MKQHGLGSQIVGGRGKCKLHLKKQHDCVKTSGSWDYEQRMGVMYGGW
jgi:hypothetical protein